MNSAWRLAFQTASGATLERRIAKCAPFTAKTRGFFPQRHDPGRQALSDFTIHRQPGRHHRRRAFSASPLSFPAACSGWEHARVILGGESFSAVAVEGLQDALWKLGGVPREHRTDSLSAAPSRTSTGTPNAISPSAYDEFIRHYGMEATRNNPGLANENGSIEGLQRFISRSGSTRDFVAEGTGISPVWKPIARSSAASASVTTARRAKPIAAEREDAQGAYPSAGQPISR